MSLCDLCRPCMEALRAEGATVKFVSGGRDNKVYCAKCGCRRYGSTYDVSGVKKKPRRRVKAHAADRS